MSTDTLTKSSETQSVAQGRWQIDPARSRVEFRTPTLWGLTTLKGHFERYEGSLDLERSPAIELVIDAASLSTKNSFRDRHLRSADFFHADEHPQAILTVTSARPAGPADLQCQGTLEAAGHVRPVTFTAHIQQATPQAAVLTAELEVDRSQFGMTWNPLHMASMSAHGTVTARFTRA